MTTLNVFNDKKEKKKLYILGPFQQKEKAKKKNYEPKSWKKKYNNSKPKCPIKTQKRKKKKEKGQNQSSPTTQDRFLNQQIY